MKIKRDNNAVSQHALNEMVDEMTLILVYKTYFQECTEVQQTNFVDKFLNEIMQKMT